MSLVLQDLDAVVSMTVSSDDLVAIDGAGRKEIDGSENPQGTIFKSDIGKRRSHHVQADESSYSEGGGEECGYSLPKAGNVALRPRQTCQEQEGYGREDNEQDDVLTIAHETAEHHAEEDAGENVGHHQS